MISSFFSRFHRPFMIFAFCPRPPFISDPVALALAQLIAHFLFSSGWREDELQDAAVTEWSCSSCTLQCFMDFMHQQLHPACLYLVPHTPSPGTPAGLMRYSTFLIKSLKGRSQVWLPWCIAFKQSLFYHWELDAWISFGHWTQQVKSFYRKANVIRARRLRAAAHFAFYGME